MFKINFCRKSAFNHRYVQSNLSFFFRQYRKICLKLLDKMKKFTLTPLLLIVSFLSQSTDASLPDQSVFEFILNRVSEGRLQVLRQNFSLITINVFAGEQQSDIPNNFEGENETPNRK